VNTVYAILESPHRWLILAGIAFTTACVGAIMMMAFTWQHAVELVWFYLFFVATLYFLARALWEWKVRISSPGAEDDGARAK
jgi:hypothetical protein